MTTSNDQFSGWTEKKFQSIYQSQTCTKKGHGPCLVICCRYDPLQLSKSPVKLRGITLKSMASKLMRCPESCNACTWHWPTEGPNSPHQCPATSHNQCFQSRMNWAITFCLICHIHLIPCQPTNHFFKQLNKFLQGNCFHNQQEAENAFQEFVKS